MRDIRFPRSPCSGSPVNTSSKWLHIVLARLRDDGIIGYVNDGYIGVVYDPNKTLPLTDESLGL